MLLVNGSLPLLELSTGKGHVSLALGNDLLWVPLAEKEVGTEANKNVEADISGECVNGLQVRKRRARDSLMLTR